MWLIKSSIGRKLVMSVSGLFLIMFLLFHASMNVAAVFSEDAYNVICKFLGANWYAVAATGVLAAGFAVHIIYALWLTLQNRRARGSDAYAVNVRPKNVEWASQNMFVIGLVVVGFFALHLTQFWYHMMFAELAEKAGLHVAIPQGIEGPHDGAGFIRYYFSQPIIVGLYLVWYAAIWFHLTHGFWSAMQTIGINNGIWMKRWKLASDIFST
ncbi:MAG: succinate dehydrogenase cytochrome b subunit, partial [Tannerellaceae bacterium]|nr:succinate dehydrogenase cytochrome b subunit [Tannerellaceae bacterium]